MHGIGIVRHVAFRIDIAVKPPPRRHVVHQLGCGNLHDPIARMWIETGGFGVDHDFAHATLPLRYRSRALRRHSPRRIRLTIAAIWRAPAPLLSAVLTTKSARRRFS